MTAVLGVMLAAQSWSQRGPWDDRWPGHLTGSVELWWLEMTGLVMTLFLVVLLAGWWRDRHQGPDPASHDQPPAGPAVPPGAGGAGPSESAAPGARGAVSPAVQGVAAPAPGARAVRISDAERDEATRRVSWAVGEGRLGLDEAAWRIEAILGARHRHEVDARVADLPELSAPAHRRAGTGRGALLAGAALVAMGAVLAQALAGLWELWPVALAVVGTWGAWRHTRPS